jgi:hypothetical protein
MSCIKVEYDFKTAKIKLFKNGYLKDKYKCLPYMITLPLTSPLNPIPDPYQPDPGNKQTILNATNTNQGWLNFNIIQNNQPNIVSILDNVLFFNKFSYNYRITVDVISKGDTTTPLRFTAQNPISLLASNMNDVYGNETVFNNLYNGKNFKFTLSGEYQFFYIYYPTTNFNLNITINIDYKNYPPLVCQDSKNNKNDCQCGQNIVITDYKNCEKCNCYIKDGNAYLKVKNDCDIINVPVYKTKVIGDTINKYLYPEFAYLRDVFYNTTLNNSLPTPTNLNSNTLNNNVTTQIVSGIYNGKNCNSYGWAYYEELSGNLVGLSSSIIGCPRNQIKELHSDTSHNFKYSWDLIPNIIIPNGNKVYFAMYIYYNNYWDIYKSYDIKENGSLDAGFIVNETDYQWVAFGLFTEGFNSYSINPDTTYIITITEIPKA